MNKIEAIKMAKLLNQQCATYHDKECKNCPLVIEKSFDYICLIDLLYDRKCNENYCDKLLVDAQKEEEEKLKNTKELNLPVSHVEQLKVIMQESLKKDKPPLNLAHDALIPSSVAKHDNVNSPKHYCKGGLECIEVIKAQLTPEQNTGYLYGNVLKYMWRWPEKNGLEDLRKAKHYLEWLIEEVNETGKPVSSAE